MSSLRVCLTLTALLFVATAVPAWGEPSARTDVPQAPLTELLPDGAVARFGSDRFRVSPYTSCATLSGDARRIAVGGRLIGDRAFRDEFTSWMLPRERN